MKDRRGKKVEGETASRLHGQWYEDYGQFLFGDFGDVKYCVIGKMVLA